MREIKRLAIQFREAIDKAYNANDFYEFPFNRFPHACCGDASDLLAQFLLEKNIRTYYVGGDDLFGNKQYHAWLLADNHIIIDITGDQFKNQSVFLNYDKPVYVGKEDDFHRLFEVESECEHYGIDALASTCHSRLKALYKIINKYI